MVTTNKTIKTLAPVRITCSLLYKSAQIPLSQSTWLHNRAM